MAYLYLERDGKVYTVERDGKLDLPREGEPIPFAYRALVRLPWGEEGVVFGVPELPRHPHEWVSKDEVPEREDASRILRLAVHRSLPRAVAEAVVREAGRYLLVRASRGLTKGLWSLPGGFLTFGEAPELAVGREVEEELGTPCRVGRLLGVRSKVGEHTGLHWLMFFYEVSLLGRPRPDPDEIAEVRFFPKAEAAARLADQTMAAFLREL
ncbi:NUDIX hydrolase [Candidatus Bipolaricaulota bacterium]|nr:NUDIX hydrolase [Candidatus Bipolaricaulota bacterium]